MCDLYINRSKAFIDFMISYQQWSGISKGEVDKWLNNFNNISQEEQRLVYKLLTNIIYFSERDVIDILRDSVFRCVAYQDVLSKQKNMEFSLSKKTLDNIYTNELSKTCFVPLLDSNAPHESGNYISRLLVQQGIIPSGNSIFISYLPELIKGKCINKLIIVDDCVGSGQQLTDFISDTRIVESGTKYTINEFCEINGISITYLTLFGNERSISELRQKLDFMDIFCARMLKEQQRVFSDESYIWDDIEERDNALNLFNELCENAQIPVYGYSGLDFAFIMHKTIPDWSLPMFWKESADWDLLVRRKNS